jgi:pantoate--beta-alanine ligase
MQILTTIAETRAACKALRRNDQTLGLVPTMGALHEGHIALIRAARANCDHVAATIFVNPTQFAPHEDLDRYPRIFDADCALLEREGVDLLFAPSAEEMYPTGADTWVDVPSIGSRLDGASRPHHFRGVATVVANLFHILQPHRAYFGQKDAAQVAVLRAMVRDLHFDLDLIVCPTVRDADGLAHSSRNRYLTPADRKQALALPQALRYLAASIEEGNHDPIQLHATLLQELQSASGLTLDYAAIVDPNTLSPVHDLTAGALIAVAAWVGNTRLIDNLLLDPVHPSAKASADLLHPPTKASADLLHPPTNGRAGLQPCHPTGQKQGALAPEADCQTPQPVEAHA